MTNEEYRAAEKRFRIHENDLEYISYEVNDAGDTHSYFQHRQTGARYNHYYEYLREIDPVLYAEREAFERERRQPDAERLRKKGWHVDAMYYEHEGTRGPERSVRGAYQLVVDRAELDKLASWFGFTLEPDDVILLPDEATGGYPLVFGKKANGYSDYTERDRIAKKYGLDVSGDDHILMNGPNGPEVIRRR